MIAENGSIGSYAAASNREAHLATNANANAKEESEPSIGNNNSPKQSDYLLERYIAFLLANEMKMLQLIIDDNNKNEYCSLEHNLPESPFASPKAGGDMATAFTNHKMEAEKVSAPSTNNDLITSPSMFPASASLDIAPFKSCYFQVPRYVHFYLLLLILLFFVIKSINYMDSI